MATDARTRDEQKRDVVQEAEAFITAPTGARPCEHYDPDRDEDVRRGEDPLCAQCHWPRADHIIRDLLAHGEADAQRIAALEQELKEARDLYEANHG